MKRGNYFYFLHWPAILLKKKMHLREWGEKIKMQRQAEVKTKGTIPDRLTIFIHSFNQHTFSKSLTF